MDRPRHAVKEQKNENFWVISEGRYSDVDLNGIGVHPVPRHVREYRISELARYMLAPHPVTVEKRLVGCEVHYDPAETGGMKDRLRRRFRKTKDGEPNGDKNLQEIILSTRDGRRPALNDQRLERHFDDIDKLLRPYDPTVKRLARLEIRKIADIVGICEDGGGGRSLLNLQGTTDEKIAYMVDRVDCPVGVLIDQAHISEGLYEMSGFDFTAFDANVALRLFKFVHEAKTRCCVLNGVGQVDFWIENPKQMHYLQLLQQSVAADTKLIEPLQLCMAGQARPLKIFFNNQLEIDYSAAHFPAVYRDVLDAHPLAGSGKNALMQALKAMQFGVAFTYVPRSRSGEERLFTNLSVMHDLKALETIREAMPQIYSAINKRSRVSEAGRYYLLDSIKGFKDDIGLRAK